MAARSACLRGICTRTLGCPRRQAQHVAASLATVVDAPVASHLSAPCRRRATGELGYCVDFYSHYHITHGVSLGRGQYGVVYRAQHRATNKSVAVKIMTKDRQDRTREDHLAAIRAEVAVWRACHDCEHVVRLEEVYEDDRFVYLVQQLCAGGDLRTVLQGGQLSEREAAQVMRAVLSVIHHCHTNNWLFGDIKPANFLLLHPHRASGCQQFPTPQPHHATTGSEQLCSASLASSESIHEHVLSNLRNSGASFGPSSSVALTTNSAAAVAFHHLPLATSTDAGGAFTSAAAAASESAIANSIVAAPSGLRLNRRPMSVLAPQHTAAALQAEAAAAVGLHAHGGPLRGNTGPLTAGVSTSMNNNMSVIGSRSAPSAAPSSAKGATSSGDAPPPWLRMLQAAESVNPCMLVGADEDEECITEALPSTKCGITCQDDITVLATDFGCCQQLAASRRKGAVCPKRIGSPVYMAPELWQAGARVGMGVDVWAAGVMLYQLLSGRYPFWTMSPHEIDNGGMQLFQVVCGVSSNKIHFSGEPWASISPACQALIKALLDRDPEHRISAHQALCHPWFKQQLGYTPVPSTPALSSSVDSSMDDTN